MGTLEVGDDIINSDGLETKITAIYPQNKKDIYKVLFSDGSSTECCGEHLWYTQTYEERNYRKRVRLEGGGRVRVGERGRDGKIRNTLEIMNSLTHTNKTNHSIPIVKPIQFKKEYVEINPYLLGCLLGDGGFTTNRITFTSNDGEIINYLNNVLPEKHIITESYPQNYVIKSIGVKENLITTYLRNVGLLGLKSDEKFIPRKYLINDVDTRLEILRGLMDTDGTVTKHSGGAIYHSTSKKLIDGVTFLVQSLGGVVHLTDKIGKYRVINGDIIECKRIYNLSINLPNDIIPFRLKRKIDLIKKRTKYKPIRFIKSIELIGEKEAQCISIDGENKLYLTNDCIVTHNTFVSCYESLCELKNNDKINKIILVKSVVTLKSEEIGFLKGTLEEKMEPFMFSFTKNFEKMIGVGNTEKLKNDKMIEVLPIAYMRGINIDNAIVIIDEAQNISIDNIRTILTRLGENSKMIFLGDTKQIDQKNKSDSALKFLMEKFNHIEGVGVVEFNLADVIRHPLIKLIEPIFEKHNEIKVKVNPPVPTPRHTNPPNWFKRNFS